MNHIATGFLLFHDGELSHNSLIEKLKLISLEWKASELKGVEEEDNTLNRINDACDYLKKFLKVYPGFSREDLQCLPNVSASS